MIHLNEKQFLFELSADRAKFSKEDGSGTYLVPTYGALRGICDAVYHPHAIMWVIDSVRIINPIQTDERAQNLLDVCYQVSAHMEWAPDCPASEQIVGKHLRMAERAFKKACEGDGWSIYIGRKEEKYKGKISPCLLDEGKSAYDAFPSVDFGQMLHSVTFPVKGEQFKTRSYWRCMMRNGTITFPRPEDCLVQKKDLYYV